MQTAARTRLMRPLEDGIEKRRGQKRWSSHTGANLVILMILRDINTQKLCACVSA